MGELNTSATFRCQHCLLTLLVTWSIFVITIFNTISGHPQCMDSYAPFDTAQLEFCQDYSLFGCCDEERDAEIEQLYQSLSGDVDSTFCQEKLKELLCQECSPYAAHLYTTETDGIRSPLPGLCQSYCTTLHQQCSSIIALVTNDTDTLEASNRSAEDFCEKVTLNDAYCYPRIRDDDNLQNWIEESRTGSGRFGDGCICLEEFANGLRNPVLAIHANDGTHRLFIAEQIGVIHVYLHDKRKLDDPFLDIQSQVLTSTRKGDERGLLGLAFHPDHASNHKLYVYYNIQSSSGQKTRISQFQVMSDDINKVNASTETIILEIPQPQANHNGGQLLFGADDGFLYAFLGDGGGAGDRFGTDGNGQNLGELLGSVIRIDIDQQEDGNQYAIPPDNPFVNEDPAERRHEIYAYGTRNMWRCSVDRGDPVTGHGRGRIFCGDVGQDLYEEVDIIVKGGNYGWRGKEGNHCYDSDLCDGLENEIEPITVYNHNIGKSVTGGYMYRGCQSPKLQANYIFGDFVNGRMFKLTEEDNGDWYREDICFGDNTICTGRHVNTYPTKILSFGEDESGEIYVLTTDQAKTQNTGGKVFRILEPSESGNCPVDRVPVTVHGNTTAFVPSQPRPDPPPILPIPTTQPDSNTSPPNPSKSYTVTPILATNYPSTSNPGEQLHCPVRCPGDLTVISEENVCGADLILKGRVQRQRMASTFRQIRLQIEEVYQSDPDNPNPTSGVILTVTGGRAHCPCPDFEDGEMYIIFASYQEAWNRFTLTRYSITRSYNFFVEYMIRFFLLQCEATQEDVIV